jgi:hypothetical protein
MPTMADPVVGRWYKHFDKGEEFEVVAVDEEARTVEIQYYDGNVDELDFYTWYQLPIEPIEAPEDQMAPMDNVEPDDLDYSETSLPESWEEAAEGSKDPKDDWDRMTGTESLGGTDEWDETTAQGSDEEP